MAKNAVSIGVELRRLQARSGLSMQQLAIEMGFRNASSVQRYLNPEYGETGPLPLRLASKFAKALAGKGEPRIEADEIYGLAGLELTNRGTVRPIDLAGALQIGLREQPLGFVEAPGLEYLLTQSRSKRDFPVYGTALGCDLDLTGANGAPAAIEQTMLEMTEAVDYLRRPANLAGRKDAYALVVAGNSMWPRFDDGDTVVVDPRRQASPGQDVIVQLRDGGGHDGDERVVAALIKRLVRRTSTTWELEQFNPPMRFTLPAAMVQAVHRIVPVGEMLGG
jgi:transcriptional regulator with XRE-family HTH domain